MCHDRTNNNKINRLHERCLRLICNDRKSFFKDLLEKDGSVFIYHKNLRILAVELLKAFKGSSPVIFAEDFQRQYKSIQNEELLIFCHSSCHNSQSWIRKFGIHRFKIVGPYSIAYERDRFY